MDVMLEQLGGLIAQGLMARHTLVLGESRQRPQRKAAQKMK
jgi:hypothetical protein